MGTLRDSIKRKTGRKTSTSSKLSEQANRRRNRDFSPSPGLPSLPLLARASPNEYVPSFSGEERANAAHTVA